MTWIYALAVTHWFAWSRRYQIARTMLPAASTHSLTHAQWDVSEVFIDCLYMEVQTIEVWITKCVLTSPCLIVGSTPFSRVLLVDGSFPFVHWHAASLMLLLALLLYLLHL